MSKGKSRLGGGNSRKALALTRKKLTTGPIVNSTSGKRTA